MRFYDKTKPLSQQPWLFGIPKDKDTKKEVHNGDY